MKKRMKAIVALVGVLMAILFSASFATRATSLSSLTSDSIKDKQNQISQAEDEKKKLQSSLTDIQNIKKELE